MLGDGARLSTGRRIGARAVFTDAVTHRRSRPSVLAPAD